MYNGCQWLPEPIKLNGSVNDAEVEDMLYSIFLKELLNGNLVYKNKPVKFRSNPKTENKEEGFFHIISGYRLKPIIEDRARRLLWGKIILENEPCKIEETIGCCKGLYVWNTREKNCFGKLRTQIFHNKASYLVILEERPNYWLYITSYRVDSSQKKRDLIQDYKRSQNYSYI